MKQFRPNILYELGKMKLHLENSINIGPHNLTKYFTPNPWVSIKDEVWYRVAVFTTRYWR